MQWKTILRIWCPDTKWERILKGKWLLLLAWPRAATSPGIPGLLFHSLPILPGPHHHGSRLSSTSFLVPSPTEHHPHQGSAQHHLPLNLQKRLFTRTTVKTLTVQRFIIQVKWAGSHHTWVCRQLPPKWDTHHCILRCKSTLLFIYIPWKGTGLRWACPGLDWREFPEMQDKKQIPASSKLFYIKN